MASSEEVNKNSKSFAFYIYISNMEEDRVRITFF